ncbi:MAG TPA: response regulator transcription factor [Mycobacteriales bacterium]|nr:response regulator transcription factor [Mycobacteriales bacterium]
MTVVSALPTAGSAEQHRAFSALVVDHQLDVRAAIAARLRALGGQDVAEAATVQQARALANAARRDLAVVDVDLPDGSGLELTAWLRDAGWRRLLVVSAHTEPHTVRAAFTAGAGGYLLKSATPTAVDEGVRRVLGGDRFTDPTLAFLPRQSVRRPAVLLSPRELEVLRLVSDGRSNKEIGESLGLSALTAKSHLARIGRKLGTGDRAEMVAVAMRAGMIS